MTIVILLGAAGVFAFTRPTPTTRSEIEGRSTAGRVVLKEVDSLRKAAEQGNASAQYNLGVRYYDGRGVPKDDAR